MQEHKNQWQGPFLHMQIIPQIERIRKLQLWGPGLLQTQNKESDGDARRKVQEQNHAMHKDETRQTYQLSAGSTNNITLKANQMKIILRIAIGEDNKIQKSITDHMFEL